MGPGSTLRRSDPASAETRCAASLSLRLRILGTSQIPELGARMRRPARRSGLLTSSSVGAIAMVFLGLSCSPARADTVTHVLTSTDQQSQTLLYMEQITNATGTIGIPVTKPFLDTNNASSPPPVGSVIQLVTQTVDVSGNT